MNGLTTPGFAALGHQEDWASIATIFRQWRPPGSAEVPLGEIKATVGWIPPRTVSRFTVARDALSPLVDGIYVETFITPDELALRSTRGAIGKVRDAIRAAKREGAPIATLGGFTSILLEAAAITPEDGIALTTGNSLTAGLIVRGVERALGLLGRDLAEETVLVIGASGDVGSGCARWLAGRCRKLLLAARNGERLNREADGLRHRGDIAVSIDTAALLPQASVVIAAASTSEPTFSLDRCAPGTLICDAGYPKNIAAHGASPGVRVFHGGMGTIAGGLRSRDGVLEQFYNFPVPDAAHGCMLEGAVLALAGRAESYSAGRGRITPDRLDEMWRMAVEQGVAPAPLFDSSGLWPEEQLALAEAGHV